ncbi:MAG TPA: cupin domain-containing protein [Bryobacteraceae bacterium]|jgi:quercetin dioxygenase-like cupin family protein
MADTTVTKVSSTFSPKGDHGETYLASGKSVSLRLWREPRREHNNSTSRRDYETAGYVISGHAELEIEGQTVKLDPGDSWVVPKGAEHRYRVLDEFLAVEATSPPAHVHGRDL